ncbi:MAG: RNA polymerase sigma factor [Acidobacteriota bacterium]
MDLSQVYRQHYRSLVRYLYRRTGDQGRAEDLAQEAFVRAIEHCPSQPRAWLFQVATNLARDEGRRQSTHRRHLTLIRSQASPAPTPPDIALERREKVLRVRAALAELSPRDRDGLLLWEEGFSYEEIARVLDLSLGSVGTTLSRARSRMAEAYKRLDATAIEVAGSKTDAAS